ncbi:FAD-dependent monooxygenase [Streptomyces xiamenensis]|uniref:FAD-dependent monooxygenase n=1 Tax=Streptomyces xiamenensis TaxID=408015 RepID=UPI00319E3846
MSEQTEVVVVGAGQAGVAMSEHLRAGGVPHTVLERHRIAERWRSERWDSLVANGPAWHDRFPGLEFSAVAPEGFAAKEQVADYFVAYGRPPTQRRPRVRTRTGSCGDSGDKAGNSVSLQKRGWVHRPSRGRCPVRDTRVGPASPIPSVHSTRASTAAPRRSPRRPRPTRSARLCATPMQGAPARLGPLWDHTSRTAQPRSTSRIRHLVSAGQSDLRKCPLP